MRYLRLVWANLRRKKIRTTLTIGSFVVALFLFGLLATLRVSFQAGADVAGVDRLTVINRTSLIMPLPYSYREKLLQVQGVKDVTFATWFGGVYQDERNFFPQFAVDTDGYRDMFPEFVISDEQWRAFVADRQGCVAGEALAKRFGWKIGYRIPIKGSYLPGMWDFNLRGIYRGTREADDTTQFWFHRDYLEENGPQWFKGLVGWYIVQVANPDDATRVVKAIDERFANSAWETKTETEKAFAASFAKQMGNIEFLIMSIGSVVFFTLLLVTGNTMAIVVRERTAELAVLKTLGFGDRLVLVLVLAESLLLAVVGGGLGVLFAKAVAPGLSRLVPGMLFILPQWDVLSGVALAAAIGLAAGLLPALAAMRLRVVDALRRV